jgi:hypothetical protein
MRTHQVDRSKVKEVLKALGTQGEYVVGVETSGKTVNLTTMHNSDEPRGEAIDDKTVLADAKPPKKKTED